MRLRPPDGLRSVRAWQGDIPIQSRYTVGVAGQPFFDALKQEGKLLASWCPDCRAAWLPPTLACPDCFRTLRDYREVHGPGRLAAATAVHRDLSDQPLSEPHRLGVVEFEGVRGGLLHRLLPDGGPPTPGDAVEMVLRERGERSGTINDIRGFRRIPET